MSAIRVSILPAFRVGAGMIGVSLWKPAIIERVVYSGKLSDVEKTLNELCAYAETLPGAWSAMIRCIDGRKPRGFDAFKLANHRDGDGTIAGPRAQVKS